MSPSENEAAWEWQWSHLEDTSEMLFREWIHPNRIEDFAGDLTRSVELFEGYDLFVRCDLED